MKFCSNCGNKVKDEYKFCPNCGTKLELEDFSSLYEKAKDFVIKNNKVSVKIIEEEFNISSSKASKIIKELETNGVVGPSKGRKGREVLANKEDVNDCNSNIDDKKTCKFKNVINKMLETEDETHNYEEEDIDKNLFLAMLSYIGIFAFIPYFMHTDSKYVKYHAVQGINLLIIEGVYTLVDESLSLIKVSKIVVDYGALVGTKMVTPIWISIPMSIVGLILSILSIIGIINVCNKKAKALPLVGKINIVK